MTLSDLRQIYGAVYVSEAPDGQNIPWKPLPIGDFITYSSLLNTADVAYRSVLEDEIFRKCVLDPVLIKNIGLQKAGTIQIVVSAVLAHSGPQSADEFNYLLEINRTVAAVPLHEMVSLICQAFPGYKPEDVYALDYSTMLLRLAMAERKLIRTGLLKEPFALVAPGSEQAPAQPQKPKIDMDALKHAFEHQDAPGPTPPPKKVGSPKNMVEADGIDIGSTQQGKDFVVSANLMAAGLDIGDDDQAKQMKHDAKDIYADYMEQAKHGKVKIKSYDERVAEAKKRAEANEKRLSSRK